MTSHQPACAAAYRPSVIHRLIDLAPHQAEEVEEAALLSWRARVDEIRGDLEELLSARRHLSRAGLGEHPQVSRSVVAFGFPELSSVAGSTAELREALEAALRDTIERFEPRLLHPRVVCLELGSGGGTARFRLEAAVRADPSPRRVAFDTTLDVDRARCAIMEVS